MPVETVFTTSPAKEAPSARRRPTDAGTAGEGEGFSLPKSGPEAAAPAGPEADQGAGGGKPVVMARQQAAAKAAGPDKPAGEAATRPQMPQGQAGSFLDALTELLAAAQEQAVPSTGEAVQEAGAKDKAGKKAGAGTEEKAKAADEETGEAAAAMAMAEQKPVLQPAAAALALPLPAFASTGGEKPDGDAAVTGGAVSAEPAKAQVPAAILLAAPAGRSKGAGLPAGEATGGSVQAAAKAAGQDAGPAGQVHKSVDGDGAGDATGAAAKADAAQGLPGTQVSPAAATEPKPAETVQQALAPIDLAALVQQAVGGTESARLLSPQDQAAAAQAPVPGHGQAALPPTPLHVLPIEIGLRALSGAKQFDIRLDPDELGRVDVNLSISDKGEVSARLVVDRVETLHLLQRDARTLERAFEQAGLKPSDGGVDISLRDPSDQSAFRQQRQHDEAPQRARQPSPAETGDDAVLTATPVPQRRIVRLGGVDLSI